MDGIESKHRNRPVEETVAAWQQMLKGSPEGLQHCLRFKMDMTAPNKALRDPVAYRCNLTSHWRTGSKYKASPLSSAAPLSALQSVHTSPIQGPVGRCDRLKSAASVSDGPAVCTCLSSRAPAAPRSLAEDQRLGRVPSEGIVASMPGGHHLHGSQHDSSLTFLAVALFCLVLVGATQGTKHRSQGPQGPQGLSPTPCRPIPRTTTPALLWMPWRG